MNNGIIKEDNILIKTEKYDLISSNDKHEENIILKNEIKLKQYNSLCF